MDAQCALFQLLWLHAALNIMPLPCLHAAVCIEASPSRPLILALGGYLSTRAGCGGPPVALNWHEPCKRTPKTLPGTLFFYARMAIAHPNFTRIFSVSRYSNIVLHATARLPLPTMFPFSHAPYCSIAWLHAHYLYSILS